jgi:hypothetical protein
MRHSLFRLIPALALCLTVAALAHAQGSTTASLSGTVVDTTGALLPGADVVVKNVATGSEYRAVSGRNGAFSIPALHAGTYSVTVSLSGFKTTVLNDVKLNAAVPATVRATLEVGRLEESVTVEAAGDIVQTQATAVSTTIDVNQITKVPVTSRNTLDFIVLQPGVSTPGGNRDSIIMGLPQASINITLDGVNVQDNTLRTTDGFFTIVQPRLDAIEEVTVTTVAQGAESSGQGAAQIRFVTRSGTNDLHGSIYHYFRHDKLNSNTWFNNRDGLARPKLVQNQPGIRVGGPIVIPGLWDGHNKGFFFINYEEFRQPQDLTRNRTILSPDAQRGIFRYQTAGGVRQINLFELAALNGHASTADPTIAKLLNDIRAATGTTGSITQLTDPNVQRYSYPVRQSAINRFPTVRLDFNLSERHRLMASTNYATFLSTPDTLNGRESYFPGFPITATQTSERLQITGALRSTFGGTVVNEFRVAGSGAPVQFFKELSPEMWRGALADQGGFHLNLNGACCSTVTQGTLNQANNLSNAGNFATPSSRNAKAKFVENTLNWLKDSHSLSFGVSFSQFDLWLRNQTQLPTLNFVPLADDPASAMFTAANFPGASAQNLQAAQGLYNILTGRVSHILGNAGLDEETGRYVYHGPRMQRGRLREMDFFAQDSWRVRPNLTLNFGVRYALQLPFEALNSSYTTGTLSNIFGVTGASPNCDPSHATAESCNLFRPGLLQGQTPQFLQLEKGVKAYNTDWNNIAPSFGVAWSPKFEDGFLRKLFGAEGDSVLRAGFARAYFRAGLADFTGQLNSNPGVLITTDRNLTLGNLGTLPVLFRERARLGAPAFAATPAYPLTDVITEDIRGFDPNLKVTYADTWSVGFQRAIGRDMRIDVRYVGSRSRGNWVQYNFNEINIVENGFLSEFRLAQANLQANIAAGRGNTFRYFGPGTGTNPLPIMLAYFSGLPSSAAGSPASYTSPLFASTTFLTPLARFNPNPFSFAQTLYGSGRHLNALRAGLPANFFLVNPDLQGGAFVTANGGFTRYHGFQVELFRRLSKGLQFQTSYEFGIPYNSDRYSFRRPGFFPSVDTGGEGGVEHALKAIWVWEVPVGKGRRFAGNASGLLDAILGGWNFSGTARIQSGRMVDFGNVRMVGFTEKDLRKMYKLRTAENGRLYMLPQDVIDNTVRAFQVSATSATGYGPLGPPTGRYFAPANGPDCLETTPLNGGFGDCGLRTLVVTGPMLRRFDLGIAKQWSLPKGLKFEFRAEMLNATNTPYFTPVTGTPQVGFLNIGNNPDGFEVTAADSGRIVQLVTRITW